ncbi:tRNA (adenosine(37)-N6)-dimethylallyltransferase MiaA [Flavipsychrobacter stenotrophus]|uniref:tRNA dimethylallyltransferase n=1 Tax=Flavipsychrobacter stenotrophus TaxID=2077091 RepID=A0A2S7STI0_9BACT|nr:tRNA (adenosine(37)-N6)-dimethylallyltransferase MiaA [Flavipsychrobacter stenotrophus]
MVIQGPTAVGKTAIAVDVAKRLGTSIVSADSRQCYKEMSIGTAKPTIEEQQGIKHYFVDDFSAIDALTVADYEQLALGYLSSIFEACDTAVVCGGTGLYIKALCEGIDPMPAVDEAITKEVNDRYAKEGITWLQDALSKEDPVYYEQMEIANPARLIRALVFIRSTGASIAAYRTNTKKQRPFKIIKVGLELPRQQLYDRINQRVDIMMENGLEVEAQSLYTSRHLKNLQTVGYVELFDYFDGKSTLAYAVDKIKQNSRNYAKRQLTWFKRDPEITWLMADDKYVVDKILELIEL